MRKDIAVFLWFVFLLVLPMVGMADTYHDNLRTCLGGYPALCNHSLLSTEHAQQVQKAEYETNLRTCLGGYPALCNHSLLSTEHAQQVQKAEYETNLRTCLGGYPALCNHSLLSTEHAQQVQKAEYETNLRTCLGGYPALCNHALLSTEHAQQVQKAEYETNLRTCLGGYPALCNHALLSTEHAQQVQKAEEYGKSANTGIYDASPSKYSSTVPVTKIQNQPYLAPSHRPQPPHPSDAPLCAENGSCYGDISPITELPKTVNVHGYFRRDGTYVRGHYRSHR